MRWPLALRTGETLREMGTSRPSLVTRSVSKCSMDSPRLKRLRISFSSARRSRGMIRVIDCPIASAAV